MSTHHVPETFWSTVILKTLSTFKYVLMKYEVHPIVMLENQESWQIYLGKKVSVGELNIRLDAVEGRTNEL